MPIIIIIFIILTYLVNLYINLIVQAVSQDKLKNIITVSLVSTDIPLLTFTKNLLIKSSD